jgi:hypothetical protein
MAGGEITRGHETAGIGSVYLIEGMDRSRGGFEKIARADGLYFLLGGFRRHENLADLNEVAIAVKAKDTPAFRGDLLWRPWRLADEDYSRLARFLNPGEAVLNLRGELGSGFLRRMGEGELNMDAMLLRDSGDSCTGSLRVWEDTNFADET